MQDTIMKLLLSQGIFAALFGYLFFYILRENSKREESYQKIVQETISLLPEIKEELLQIKNKLDEK